MAATGKKKIDELTMVKGLVILFIFFVHLSDMTGLTDLYLSYTSWVYSGATLLLMIFCFLCSGYVYSAGETGPKDIAKKVRHLVMPRIRIGLIFLAVYFLRYVIIEARPLRWYLDNAMADLAGLQNWNIRLGKAYSNQMLYAFAAYWFVDEMLAAYCLFIPLRKLTEGRRAYIRAILSAVLLAAAMLCSRFDVQHTLEEIYTTNVPYCLILINIFGLSALLMIGSLMKEARFLEPDMHSKAFNAAMAAVSVAVILLYIRLYKPTDYALQYGKWGAYGSLSIPLTAFASIWFLYLTVLLFHYAKKLTLIKKFLCCIGENSLEILLLHIGLAEIITWVGGYWKDYYSEPFQEGEFSAMRCVITFAGTIAALAVYLTVKRAASRRKQHSSLRCLEHVCKEKRT